MKRQTLHIIRQSLSVEEWQVCARRYRGGFILIENAVLRTTSHIAERIGLAELARQQPVYVLSDDLVLRGVDLNKLHADLRVVDYAGFVDLCVSYQTITNV